MKRQLYVTNASPLIIFERVGQLTLLRDLFGQVDIPTAVRREVFGADPLPAWIEEHKLAQPLAAQVLAAQLGAGEREAITLALELQATWLLIDDLPAQRLAQSLGLIIVGSAGLLLPAKAEGLIPAVRPLLEAMRNAEFRISDRVFATIIAEAGED